MKKRTLIILLFIIVLGLGCEKDAEIALPEYKPTLTIHSYISPLDPKLIVYVNWSKAATNNNFNDKKNVSDATVKISDGTTTVTLSYAPSLSPEEFAYYFVDSVSFKVTAGKTYSLSVTTPDGKLATATTTIPEVVVANSLSYQLISTQFSFDSVYQIKFNFQDPLGHDDYYKFGAYLLDIDTILGDTLPATSEQFGTYFASDGGLIAESMEAYRPWSQGLPEQVIMLDFRLCHVSREYYLYSQSINNSGSGPFSEPSVPFTNLSGGVGVFAGYNYQQEIIRVK